MRSAPKQLLQWMVSVTLCGAIHANAASIGSEGSFLSMEVHGFASPGFIYSTHQNNYLAKSAPAGSFEFAEVGINFTKTITESLRTGLQLFAQELGPLANFHPRVDWFYLDYRWKDWLSIRAGRIKAPFGLYNDISDIDSARVPVLLPQAVYPATSRDLLLAITGGEIYGHARIGHAGALDYRLYGGTISLEIAVAPGSPTQIQDLTVPYLVGARLFWETPIEGFRIGVSAEALKIDSNLILTEPPPPTAITVGIPALLWVASVEYLKNDLLIAAEYGRWHVGLTSNSPLIPPMYISSERAYAMISYRINDWFQPGFYASILFPNVEKRTGTRADRQFDFAGTLRFDVNEYWLIKLEGHYMNGTGVLTPSLNNNRAISTLAENWAVFFVKTTAHF